MRRITNMFRTPLNANVGLSHGLLAERSGWNDAQKRDQLEKINVAGGQLARLVDDVIILNLQDEGLLAMQPTAIDACSILKRCVEDLATAVERAGMHLSVEIPDPGILLLIDSEKMHCVVDHLVLSAVARAGSGRIRLRCGLDDNQAGWLENRDEGPGLRQAEGSCLFTELKRNFSHPDGIGLGFAVVQILTEKMGGTLEAENRIPRSLCLRLRLQVVKQPAESLQLAAGSVQSEAFEDGTVLVIDGDDTARRLIAAQLLELGLEVEATGSSQVGIYRARNLRPAVIVMDMMREGEAGRMLLSTLSRDPILTAIPVIVYSVMDP